jgi:hypothetical protein
MRKTILALFGALLLGGPLLAADKPLVIEAGQTKQLPAATSLQLSAPTTANATINMPHGTAPTTPTNGDCWTTTTGLFCRINGATVGPYGSGGGSVSLTGDITGSGTGSIATTLTTVNSNVGSFGSATQSLTATVNAKGLITAISAQTVTPAFSSITGTAAVTQGGTGLATATLGDLHYGSGTNTLAILGGNTTGTKKFLSQTGTGTVSAAPAWSTLAATDMPALTGGDVTSSAGSGTLTIGANKVLDSMLRQSTGLSLIGRSASTTGNVADITAASDAQIMRRSGTAIGFGSIDLSQSAAVGTSRLPLANLAQGSALSVLGVAGNATADNASIAAASDNQVLRRSGTALGFGSVNLASSSAVTGTLPVGNGGTGTTTSTGTGSVVLSASPTFTGSPVLPSPSATALTLLNSVTNVGGAYATAGFRKYADGRVAVEGWLQGGGGTSPIQIATLPVGARPLANQTFACVSFASGTPSTCMFEVQATTGGVYWYSSNTSAAFSISGINFQS